MLASVPRGMSDMWLRTIASTRSIKAITKREGDRNPQYSDKARTSWYDSFFMLRFILLLVLFMTAKIMQSVGNSSTKTKKDRNNI